MKKRQGIDNKLDGHDMTVCIVIPTINEITGLKEIVPKINREWYDRLIIVDGNSTDGTVEYARSQGYEVIVQENKGMRMGHIQYYSQIKEDIIVLFSPDGNSVAATIPLLIDEIKNGYDLVLASRYKDDAISDDDTFLTRIGNYVFTKLICLFGYPYTDAMVMFRAFRREVPENLRLNRLRSPIYEKSIGRFVSWEPLMSIRAAKVKMKIVELPSDEPARIDETNKGFFLPTSRINHFKVGLAILSLVIEELVFRRF